MRFSIIIPEELAATVRARAEQTGLSLAEIGRRALLAWCATDGVSDAAPYATDAMPGAGSDAEDITLGEASRTSANEIVAALTAERDALAARVRELERMNQGAADEIAAALADRDRERGESERSRDAVIRAETRVAAIASEYDRLQEDFASLTARATGAETRAAIADADIARARESTAMMLAEKYERIADLRRTVATLEGQLATMTILASRAIPEPVAARQPWWAFWRRAAT